MSFTNKIQMILDIRRRRNERNIGASRLKSRNKQEIVKMDKLLQDPNITDSKKEEIKKIMSMMSDNKI